MSIDKINGIANAEVKNLHIAKIGEDLADEISDLLVKRVLEQATEVGGIGQETFIINIVPIGILMSLAKFTQAGPDNPYGVIMFVTFLESIERMVQKNLDLYGRDKSLLKDVPSTTYYKLGQELERKDL